MKTKLLSVLSAFAMSITMAAAAALPVGYTPVDYIESDGTQMVPLDGTKLLATWRLEFNFSPMAIESEKAYFGNSWSGGASLLDQRGHELEYYGNGVDIFTDMQIGDRIYVSFDPTDGLISTNYTSGKVYTNATQKLNGHSLCIFSCNSSSRNSKMRFYSMKAWNADGELFYDLVPCITMVDGSLVHGLYNLAAAEGATVFYSSTTGNDFTHGELLSNGIVISGDPSNVSAPTSQCGSVSSTEYGDLVLTPGEEFSSKIEETIVVKDTLRSIFKGWVLTVEHASGETTEVVSTSTNDVCRYTFADGDIATLVYNWDSEYLVKVEAASGLLPSVSSQWVKAGEEITISIAEADATFVCWNGDVPTAIKWDDTITLTVDKPLAITAVSRKSRGGTLPAGYTPVEYLESTGKQSINLGMNSISMSASLATLEIDFTMTSVSGNTAAFGAWWGNGSLISIQSGAIKYFGAGDWIIGVADNDRTFIRIDPKDGLFATNYTSGASSRQSHIRLSSNNAAVFDCNNSGFRAKMKLFSLKFWNPQGTLIRDMVPCIEDATETAGLYDVVNGVFYTDSVGTEAFKTGDSLNNTVTVKSNILGLGEPQVQDGDAEASTGYGIFDTTADNLVTATMPTKVYIRDIGTYTLSGWELYERYSNGTYSEKKSTSADEACTYTAAEGTAAEITWKWSLTSLNVETTISDIGVPHVVYGTEQLSGDGYGSYGIRVGDSVTITMPVTSYDKDGVAYTLAGWTRTTTAKTGVMTTVTGATEDACTFTVVEGDKIVVTWNWTSTSLTVASNIDGIGKPKTEYGETTTEGYGAIPVKNGNSVKVTMPEVQIVADGITYTLAGWDLSITDKAGEVTISKSASRDEACTFTAQDGDIITLTWNWNKTTLSIVSSAEGVGVPESSYGNQTANTYGSHAIKNSDSVTVAMKEKTVIIDGVRHTLTGWTLTITDIDGKTETKQSTSAGEACSFTASEGDIVVLTWQWKLDYLVSIVAERGLKVSVNGAVAVTAYEAFADMNTQITVSYIEDGEAFFGWGGDVLAENGYDKTITLTVTGPLTVKATTMGRCYVAAGKNGDGTSWETAYGTIQEAFEELEIKKGARLYIASGTYLVSETLANGSSLTDLIIEGGFTSDGTSKEGETVIARDPSVTSCQIMAFDGMENLVINSVVISNGFKSVSSLYGLGLGITDVTTAAITNCAFRRNGQAGTINKAPLYGSALGIKNSTVTIYDCDFADNRLWCNNADGRFGGALAANNSSVIVKNSRFDRNMTYCGNSWGADGGAIALLSCNDAIIDGCTFTTNYVRRGDGENTHNSTGNHNGNGPFGGTIYLEGSKRVQINDAEMIGGCNIVVDTTKAGITFGGFVFVNGGSSAAITKSKFINGATHNFATCKENSSADKQANGGVDVNGGSLSITDSLFAGARKGWYIGNQGGNVAVTNCTFVGHQNTTFLTVNQVYVGYNAKKTTFKNCIVWDNDVAFRDASITTCTNVEATDSIIEGVTDEESRVWSKDPRFVDSDNGDYHLGPYSAARNKGDSTGFTRITDLDLDGNKRIVGKEIDLGCYESQRAPTIMTLQ